MLCEQLRAAGNRLCDRSCGRRRDRHRRPDRQSNGTVRYGPEESLSPVQPCPGLQAGSKDRRPDGFLRPGQSQEMDGGIRRPQDQETLYRYRQCSTPVKIPGLSPVRIFNSKKNKMRHLSKYSGFVFLLAAAPLFFTGSCKRKIYALLNLPYKVDKEAIKRTLGPNIVGQQIE